MFSTDDLPQAILPAPEPLPRSRRAPAHSRAQLADPQGLPLSMRLLKRRTSGSARGPRRREAARRGAAQPELDRRQPPRQRRVRAAATAARELFALAAADGARVLAHEDMSVAALRLFEGLPRHPVVTVASVMKLVETTKPTAGRAIELLVAADVLVEATGKKRDRSYGMAGGSSRIGGAHDPDSVAGERAP
jgi:hypothetical protein